MMERQRDSQLGSQLGSQLDLDAVQAFVRIAELLGDNPGIRPEDVFVTLIDAAKENWSVGHGLTQFA